MRDPKRRRQRQRPERRPAQDASGLPDLDAVDLPDADAEALAALNKLTDEVRPVVVTPPDERFPPVDPSKQPAYRPQGTATRQPTTAERAQALARAKSAQRRARRRRVLYNGMSLLAVLGSLAIVVYIGILWQNPLSPLNLFPPPTPFVYITATPSPSAFQQLPEDVQRVLATAQPATPLSASPYVFISTGVTHRANTNGRGCNWASIAGTVTAADGSGLSGFRVQVSGNGLSETAFSGAARTFGAGGFELPLANAPQADTYSVQLLSAQGVPLSDVFNIETFADCERNVTLIDFVQNRAL